MTMATLPEQRPPDQSPTKVNLDPLRRFADRAHDYARWRPGYPSEAIDAILDGWDHPEPCRIADVGAGTGISSRALALAGALVHAVEPNESMRSMGRAAGGDGVEWIDATGEGTGLGDHAVDAVTCFQAFHWLDADQALTEFVRILDPASPLRRVALVWNEHDEAQPIMRGYQAILKQFAVDRPLSRWARPDVVPLSDAPGFANYRLLRFPNEQRLDERGLLGRAMSASYLPREGGVRAELENALRGLFQAHETGGQVRLAYVTAVHLAELED
jgi:SAM-dependent methyltransferase